MEANRGSDRRSSSWRNGKVIDSTYIQRPPVIFHLPVLLCEAVRRVHRYFVHRERLGNLYAPRSSQWRSSKDVHEGMNYKPRSRHWKEGLGT